MDAPARLEEQVRASAAPELAPLHELMARGRERVRRGTIVCPWGRARFAEWFLPVRETMRWCDAQCIEDHDPAAIRAQCEEAIERLGLASVADELESSGAPGATGNILPTPVVG